MKMKLLGLLTIFSALCAPAAEIKIMSFNIAHGEGMDKKIDLSRTAAAIAREQPDFVGVQEVDWWTARSGQVDQPAELARLTGLHATFSRAIFFDGGQYGVMLLSREVPRNKIEIPLPGKEPRVLLLCEFTDCVVGTMHLSVDAELERLASIPLVREAVEKFAATKPVFLTGDWNSLPSSSVLTGLREFLAIRSTEDSPTFHDCPQKGPCIDYISVDRRHAAQFTISDARVVEDRQTSDHAPIVATFSFEGLVLDKPSLVPAPKSFRPAEGSYGVRAVEVSSQFVQNTTDASLPPEGYRLTIEPTGIRVSSATPTGAFYALQTLRQLGTARWGWLYFPCCTIEDAPQFGWRGVHIDDSRHFFGKATVKRVLELMAQHKLNVLHWHLTDGAGWRVPMPKYPRLTTVGATRNYSTDPKDLADHFEDGVYGPFSYSEADIREVRAFAQARHIRIVPEIDFPGHSRAALKAYPELACFPNGAGAPKGAVDNVFCLGNDAAITFMKDALSELCRLFPDSPIIHIGGDEVNKVNWRSCPKCQARMKALGIDTPNAFQAKLMEVLSEHLAQQGRRAIGWDELILDGQAPKNSIVMSWRGAEGAIAAAKAGHESVMCPHVDCYFDYTQNLPDDPHTYPWFTCNLPLKRAYQYDPFAGIPAAMRGLVLGGQCCNWAEYTCNETELQWKMWPRTCSTAEIFWTGEKRPGFDDFLARMQTHRRRLIRQGVNCAPCSDGN